MNPEGSPGRIFEHLEELRARVIQSLVFFIIACFFVYPYAGFVLGCVIKPIGVVVFTSPAEGLLAHINITLYLAFFISLPFFLFEAWQFVGAGLKPRERRYGILFLFLSCGLFITGAVFAYFLVVPMVLKFLLGFSSNRLMPMIAVGPYVSFAGTIALVFGLSFELPLLIVFLTKAGIVTPQFLSEKRKYAIVLIFIISAILTPPDCLSQILMAVPLVVLYEIGAVLSKLASGQGKK